METLTLDPPPPEHLDNNIMNISMDLMKCMRHSINTIMDM
jgi:hypothetical protein